MATGEEKTKTSAQGSGKVVKGKYEPEIYLHPSSATVLCVDAIAEKTIKEEHYFLSGLLEKQLKAQKDLDEANYAAILQADTVPERQLQSKVTEAYAALNKANKAFRQELMTLTANVPEGELLDEKMKESAIGIMELIPLNKNSVTGFKKTYIRSEKIKEDWRRYKLSNVDKKTGEASFIKYHDKNISVQDENGKTVNKTVRQAKIDPQELKKQLKEASVKFKFDICEDSNIIVSDWAKEMNKSLSWPKGGNADESVYHQYVDISAQAQLMRFSHGAGISAEFNPLKGKVEGKLEGHASFALGEAKAESTLYVPDRLGISLLFPAKADTPQTPGGICNMGALRFALKMVLSGSVGASVAVEVGATLDWSGEMGKGYGIKGRPAELSPPPLPGKRTINLHTPETPEAQGGGEIGAFVGAQFGGNISGAIEWFDPHPDDTPPANVGKTDDKTIVSKERKFAAIAKLEMGVSLQAGAGGSAVFYVTYIQGRFRIFCKAAFCWGAGAKGSLGFEVDGGCYLAFMKSFMYMLRNVDYQKLADMMELDAFQALCAIPLIMAARGVQAAVAMADQAMDIITQLGDDLTEENNRVKLMESVLNNPDQFKYSPPETKGALIAQLMDINWADPLDPRNQNNNPLTFNSWKLGPMKRRKQAIFLALKWVQSKADYDNVMQHITESPGKGKGDRNKNEQAVITFLSDGENDSIFFTHYGKKLPELYNNLPERVSPEEPFKPIPDKLMDQYLALIDQQQTYDPMSDDGQTRTV
ncbi:hypothetical protein ROT99_20010 [Citrobacter freundii complex sp. 2023EL-00966]|uniref:hypothetical protein n=1 Tax=Citrobacter freundii complex sp. 2023EL-00966 TaxID=3076118 RepID=UPI002895FAC8|nr:hypothetical protein [Citrobacter freundii complex sp. 2023EL-00966]MDT3754625.1 hypothetical protein [Citrobacter freundii complex sp. 2023EL-00966]